LTPLRKGGNEGIFRAGKEREGLVGDRLERGEDSITEIGKGKKKRVNNMAKNIVIAGQRKCKQNL